MLTVFLIGCVMLCMVILGLMVVFLLVLLPFVLVGKLIQWAVDYHDISKGLEGQSDG